MTLTKARYQCVCILLVVCIAFTCFSFSKASGEAAVFSAPLVRMNSTSGMVRVFLSSLGNPGNLTLTVKGSYSVNGNVNQPLSNGEQLTVQFNSTSGKLTLTRNGSATDMGSEFALRRHSTSGSNGILIAQSKESGNPYPGDLRFVVQPSGSGYKLYTITNVYIEDYLYGVVPYEIGSGAHLEAMKAQAVAARTYTLRKMQTRASNLYDVVDTTNDQVYRGTPSGSAKCKSAVDATKGIVVMNSSELTQTYYTASNGGQTEASGNPWSSSLSYLTVKDDPFDLANPDSVVKSATVYGDFSNISQKSGLVTLLNSKAMAQLNEKGYNTSGAQIITIDKVVPHTPQYASPSRLYTKMDFYVTAKAVNSQGNEASVSLQLTCNIFGELESLLAISINGSNNELWTVDNNGKNFILRARRYGHGIGMSQRGAMQMGTMGYTYDQILGFYYVGCKRAQYTFTHTILSAIDSGNASTITVTEDPAEITGEEALCTAVVNLVNHTDVLAIRAAANAQGQIIGTVPHGAPVKVYAIGDVWCFISYGSLQGYVQESALIVSGDAPSATEKTPTQIVGYAVVTAENYLNLRKEGSTSAEVVGKVSAGAVLSVLSKSGQWAYVQHGALTAYASVDFLNFSATYPGAVADPENTQAVVTLTNTSETVNLRGTASTSGAVLAKLAHGAMVTVVKNDGAWCYVTYQGTYGYVMSSFLTAGTSEVTPVPEPEKPGLNEGEIVAIAAPEDGTVPLYEQGNEGSGILAAIPKGESVIVVKRNTDWCQVRYSGVNGYVQTSQLTFDNDEETPVVSYATVTTVSGSLNLRTLPKAGSTILCTLPRNARVGVLEKGMVWTNVTYENYTGYVMSEFLTFGGDGTTTETPPSLTAVVTTASGSLNLRQAGQYGSKVLCTVPQNTVLPIYEKGDIWSLTEYRGHRGYVMNDFLTFPDPLVTPAPEASASPEPSDSVAPSESPVPSSTPESSDLPEPTTLPEPSNTPMPTNEPQLMARVTTKSGSLNLRANPGAAILARIPQGTIVLVVEKGESWSKVNYGGIVGYAMNTFLTFEQGGEEAPTPAPIPTMEPGSETINAWVNTASGSLNLRELPKSGAKILLRIPKNAKVLVYEKDIDWCVVKYSETLGYVQSKYLKFDQELPTEEGEPKEQQDAWVLTSSGSLNMRKAPNGEWIASIPRLGKVSVLEKGTTWSNIRYGVLNGYVMTQYLTFTNPDGQPTPVAPTAAPEKQPEEEASKEPEKTAPTEETENPPTATPESENQSEQGSEEEKTELPTQTVVEATPEPASPVLDPTLQKVTPFDAQVTKQEAQMILFKECDDSGEQLKRMIGGDYLTVIQKGSTWCSVVYEGKTGFCLTKYLIME